ncbi:MAG: hypothetical protein ABIK67_07720 [candidate division WOR-3 bacterium]
MKKLNEIEIYLLQNWDTVAKIKNEAESLQEKFDEECAKACAELQNREWWNEEFEEPEYKRDGDHGYQIFCSKKSWHFGKDWFDHVELVVADLSLDSLMESGEYMPNAAVWTVRLKKLGEGKRETFEELYTTYSKKIKTSLPPGLKIFKDPESAFCYYLPYTKDQWIEKLKEGKFVETILEHFDILAQFIDPIDRALAEVLGKKRAKK